MDRGASEWDCIALVGCAWFRSVACLFVLWVWVFGWGGDRKKNSLRSIDLIYYLSLSFMKVVILKQKYDENQKGR